MGNINVYSGPMKSGKTQEILNEYRDVALKPPYDIV